mmetsp:Transcript_19412/g.42049  ORF Transcript_19412/g.42049 Transcript_19412/m.42049 type:complete len:493 (-) Transcript_19412:1312-2790(-)
MCSFKWHCSIAISSCPPNRYLTNIEMMVKYNPQSHITYGIALYTCLSYNIYDFAVCIHAHSAVIRRGATAGCPLVGRLLTGDLVRLHGGALTHGSLHTAGRQVCQVGVLQALLPAQPLVGVHGQQSSHEVQLNLVHLVLVPGGQGHGLLDVEHDALVVRVAVKQLLLAGRDWPQDLLDLVQLVQVAVARKQGLAVHQLTHEAADGPHVDGRPVHGLHVLALLPEGGAQQQLGGAVPPRGHVVCQGLPGLVDEARKSKIAQLEPAVLVHQQVLWLDVAVDHPLLVYVGDGGAQLVENEAHRLPVHATRLRLKQLQQVARHKLHDDEEPVAHKELVDKLHHVGVLQSAQQGHLAAAGALDVLGIWVVVLYLEFLDGDDALRALHAALDHHAVRALPHHVLHLVLLAQDASAVDHHVVHAVGLLGAAPRGRGDVLDGADSVSGDRQHLCAVILAIVHAHIRRPQVHVLGVTVLVLLIITTVTSAPPLLRIPLRKE